MRGTWLASLVLSSTLALGCASSGAVPPPELAEPVKVPVKTPTPAPAPAPTPAPAPLVAQAPAAQADVEVTASRPVLAADKEEEIFVRVRVRGLPLVEKARPPINLAVVVDASGSMDGDGIAQAKAACTSVVDAMKEGDALSIVTFGSRPAVVVSAKRIDDESRAAAKKAIAAIVADGTTDMTGGLRVGLEQLREHMKPDGINRIVLVGDGVPNDAASATALADQANAQRVPITSLGLGPEFDETLMARLAERSGGSFHFIDDPAKVTKVFQEQIGKMNRLVARNTWVELAGGPGVSIVEGFGVGASGRTARIHIGDLTEGQVRDTYLRVKLSGHRDGLKVELFDATVHHQLPAGGADIPVSTFASLRASSDPEARREANKEVEHGAAKVRVADGIVRGIALARAGDLASARKLLDAVSKVAQEGAKRFEDAELKGRVEEIAKLKKTLHTLVPAPISPFAGLGAGAGAAPRPMKSVATPAESLGVRSSHGDAMRVLQGF